MIDKTNTTDARPFASLSKQSLFLVWGPPSHGARSRVFAEKLGIKECHFLHITSRRGFWAAPIKYSYQAVATLVLLFRKRPRIVFLQSPPSFAALFVYIYCATTKSQYIVDAHSDALQSVYWTRPRWLYNFLASKAVTTIVTNEHFRQLIQRRGGHATVLRDIPTTFFTAADYPVEGNFRVAVVSTFAGDEPLDEILEAAEKCGDVNFYITGSKKRASSGMLAGAPANVHFTDFLPNKSYYGLLQSSDAVMCLTTRNHTMQRGACEALSLGRPIITSDWPLLKDYFCQGTIHAKNTADGIRRAVVDMKRYHRRYETEIGVMQQEQQREWREHLEALVDLIGSSTADHRDRVKV